MAKRQGRRYAGVLAAVCADQRILPYLYVSPAVFAMVWVHIIPMVWGILVSFRKLNVYYIRRWSQAPFIGLGNYARVLSFMGGNEFFNSLRVTLLFVAFSLAGCYVMGMVSALVLSQRFRGRNLLRGLMLLPYITPQVVSIVTMRFIFERDWGIVNYVLEKLHIIEEPASWLVGPLSLVTMTVAYIWIQWPFWFVTLLAGLQTIPEEIYQAAEIDGASPLQKFRLITLPLLKPVTTVLVLVGFLWAFNNFSVAYVLFGNTPSPNADVISLHIYNLSFVQWNFGLASAMAFTVMLFLLVMVVGYTSLFRMGAGVR